MFKTLFLKVTDPKYVETNRIEIKRKLVKKTENFKFLLKTENRWKVCRNGSKQSEPINKQRFLNFSHKFATDQKYAETDQKQEETYSEFITFSENRKRIKIMRERNEKKINQSTNWKFITFSENWKLIKNIQKWV